MSACNRQMPQIHTWVEEDKAIRANQIDTTTSGFAAKQENELLPGGIIELVDEFLPFVDGHSTV